MNSFNTFSQIFDKVWKFRIQLSQKFKCNAKKEQRWHNGCLSQTACLYNCHLLWVARMAGQCRLQKRHFWLPWTLVQIRYLMKTHETRVTSRRTLQQKKLKKVNIFESAIIPFRGANRYQICSFFEHCLKSLWPPPPSFWTSCCRFFWWIS